MKSLDIKEFAWMNESSYQVDENRLTISATPKSDFFCNTGVISEEGITPASLSNAPFLFKEVFGDFVMRVRVSHKFQDIYDAATIMVMKDLSVWAKACFEKTDFDTRAVVSVVTNNCSDDANGCNVNTDWVWLQVARVGNAFAFHYSLDGERFDMMRFFSLPAGESVKVGLLAQAPLGQGGERFFASFSLEERTVKNIREGK